MLNNHKKSYALEDWVDWRWQQKNACRDMSSLISIFKGLDDRTANAIEKNLTHQKIQITPYYIALIRETLDESGLLNSPLFRQVVPFWDREPVGGYDGYSENWELNHEMKTPICQHKYDNRVILRLINTCNSYCQFCFEALRTLKPVSDKQNSKQRHFQDSLDYIKNTPSIDEVVLSGGDPLMLTDNKLKESLTAIRAISDDLLIRLHSRALTFNPFRVTDQLTQAFDACRLSSFGVHVCHPSELTDEFATAIRSIQRSVPLVFSNTPLLKGVNDNEDVLRELFIKLYRLGVKPYYLYHYMPFSPGAEVYKTSIADAVKIMTNLKRRISNIALPEYVIPHEEGKFTVPLLNPDDLAPHYRSRDGERYYAFKNWKGDICEWLDT